MRHINKIQLVSISNDPNYGYSDGFYATFEDGLDIQYEPKSKIFNEKKKTLWIHADPDEVNIAFFHDNFNLGFNSQNETGVWLSLSDGTLTYHKDVVAKLRT